MAGLRAISFAVWAWVPVLLAPAMARAQDPAGVEVLVPREVVSDQLVPLILNGWVESAQHDLNQRAAELNEPTRESAQVRLADPAPVIERVRNALPEQRRTAWDPIFEQLADYEVVLDIDYELHRGVRQVEATFPESADPATLTSVNARVDARPKVRVRGLLGHLENRKTGERIELPLSIEQLTKSRRPLAVPDLNIDLTFDIRDDLQATARGGHPIRMERTSMSTNLREVKLDPKTVARLVDAAWTCDNIESFVKAGTRTRLWDRARKLLASELRDSLGSESVDAVVWMEADDDGKLAPKVGFPSPELTRRLDAMEQQGRLVFQGTSKLPLQIEVLDVELLPDERRVATTVILPPQLDVTVSVERMHFPASWAEATSSEPLAEMLQRLSDDNLAARGLTATIPVTFPTVTNHLELPYECKDGVFQLRPEQMKLSLDAIADARVGAVTLASPGTSTTATVDPAAGNLADQAFDALPAMLALGRSAAGDDLFRQLERAIQQELEGEIQAIGAQTPEVVTEGSTRVGFRVVRFELPGEQSLHVDWDGTGANEEATRGGALRSSASKSRLPAEYRQRKLDQQPALHTFQARLDFPSEIVIELSDARTGAGSISGRTLVRLLSKDPHPYLQATFKVVRDPATGALVILPETDNIRSLVDSFRVGEDDRDIVFTGDISGEGTRGFVGDAIQWLGDAIAPDPENISLWNASYYLIGHEMKRSVTDEEESEARTAIREALIAAQGDLTHVLWDQALRAINGRLEDRAGEPSPRKDPDLARLEEYLRQEEQRKRQQVAASVLGNPQRPVRMHRFSTIDCHGTHHSRDAYASLAGTMRPAFDYVGLFDSPSHDPEFGVLGTLQSDLTRQFEVFESAFPHDRRLGGLELDGRTLTEVAQAEARRMITGNITGRDRMDAWPAQWSNEGIAEQLKSVRGQLADDFQNIPSDIADDVEQQLGRNIDDMADEVSGDASGALTDFLHIDSTPHLEKAGFQAPAITSAHLVTHRATTPYYDLLLYTDAGRRWGRVRRSPRGALVAGRPLGSMPLSTLTAGGVNEPLAVLSVDEANAAVADNLERLRQLMLEYIRYEHDDEGNLKTNSRGKPIERFGINDTLDLRLLAPRFSIEGGRLAVDVEFEVEQDAVLTQNIPVAGQLVGWLVDGILTPALAVDTGRMRARLVLDVGDPVNLEKRGKHVGYGIPIRTHDLKMHIPSGLKPLLTGIFEDEAEENLRDLDTTVHIPRVVEFPGSDGAVTFKLGGLRMLENSGKEAIGLELEPVVDPERASRPTLVIRPE